MTSIAFAVAGMPMSQGSKKAFVNPATGKVIITESGGAKHHSWREAVRAEAQRATEAVPGWAPLDGPLVCKINLFLPRPKAAPKRIWAPHTGLDLDKCVRSVFDAMKGVVLVDDARVVKLEATKHFAEADKLTGARIYVATLDGEEKPKA